VLDIIFCSGDSLIVMLAKRILPCRCESRAGGERSNFVNLQDAGDPVELAKVYNHAGADELCFRYHGNSKTRTLSLIVYRTAEQVFIPLTVWVDSVSKKY